VDEPGHDFEPEPWGEDRKLVEVLGERGADGFRALLEGLRRMPTWWRTT
jgi:hypothetical protein